MVVQSNIYADFKILVAALINAPDVYSYENPGVNWYAYAFDGGNCVLVSEAGSLPGSFATDFPSATALGSVISVS